ncbi:MAG: hypothetical protein ACI3XJ_01995 [Oscillospiraceae bacterium]
MILMNILRMLADVAFYGTFAGLIALKCGGGGAFAGALIQSICFGLSSAAGKKRPLRLALLLPMALGWVICRNSLADCILLLPTAVYIIWLVWKGDYALDHERQQRLFGVFWKVLLVFVPLAMLMGGTAAVTAVSMPYALTMLVCSVLLLRALRHDPRVYCQKKYQLVNISAVALVVAAARLISSKTFLNGCAAVGRAVFSHVVQPVLKILLDLLMLVIYGISKLVSLFSFGGGEQQEKETVELDLRGAEELLGDDFQQRELSPLLRVLGWALLIAAAAALLVLFFRWMNKRHGHGAVQNTAPDARESVPVSRREARKRETSPVRKIRAQYRGFLKWCSGLGVETHTDSTSLDVHRQFSAVSGRGEISARIRELYIRARYAEKADPDDARKMKQLCTEIKKTGPDGS